MNKLDWVVSPAIAGYYTVKNTTVPILHSKIGEVDLRRITIEQADQIFLKGTIYLERVKRKREKPAN